MICPVPNPQERLALLAYIASKTGTTPQALVGHMPFEVIRVDRAGKPIGAVLYTNFRGYSIEISAAGESGWLTRATIQGALAYPFIQLKCWTVFTLVNRTNTRSRELQRRLGFTEMCTISINGEKSDDVVLYGMTRDKCLWLQGLPKPFMNGMNYHAERTEAA